MKENIPLYQNEEITPIRGYEGLYSITSFGRVWSHKRINNYGRRCGGKFLKYGIHREGYLYVVLYIEGNTKTYSIHILVAQAFIPNPQNLPEVNHKDGNKLNCKKDNLEWCTQRYNRNHAMVNNLLKYKRYSRYYGVSFDKSRNKSWRVNLILNKQYIHIGNFKIEAAKAYNTYVIEHNLNRPLNNI